MRPERRWFLALTVCLLLAAFWSCETAPAAPRIDKETLKSWLGNPEVVILDVRVAKDWQGSDKKIKGAVRQDPKDVKTWAASLPKDKKIVLYCT
jgi:rhodanese-related sulfurtransferase